MSGTSKHIRAASLLRNGQAKKRKKKRKEKKRKEK
jgi:hypothetical protein